MFGFRWLITAKDIQPKGYCWPGFVFTQCYLLKQQVYFFYLIRSRKACIALGSLHQILRNEFGTYALKQTCMLTHKSIVPASFVPVKIYKCLIIPVWLLIPQSSSAAGCPRLQGSLSPLSTGASLLHYTSYTAHTQTCPQFTPKHTSVTIICLYQQLAALIQNSNDAYISHFMKALNTSHPKRNQCELSVTVSNLLSLT